ncbi:MAG: MiaB/RimO family radical SAM methylthiotransferase [bacterium]|nr:MiaB/RimO family radical SAM methylthiotransferase [bacterium]
MKYFIKTFGCAANEADAERIAGYYETKGLKRAKTMETADVVVINTCSVRQSAEHRAYGLINNLAKKRQNSTSPRLRRTKQKIVLAGCMLRYGVTTLKEKMSQVDEFLRIEELEKTVPKREKKETALVSIMEGCNNFCTYCVVPYARGREKSKPFEEIVCEVEELAKRGYKEITLIGQNVNSYGRDFNNDSNHLNRTLSFAQLLSRLNQIESLEKISFLTSNPWDLTDDTIQSIKLPKIDKYLHLAVQSGDDEILRRMNRSYRANEYLSLINKIREEIPEIKIGTDIIVGFPGESKEQFEKTVKLCKQAKFVKAYVARYSPRPGTAAYKFPDDVSAQEKKRRWQVLEELINK